MAAITPPSMNIINMMKDAIKQAKAFIINFVSILLACSFLF